MKVVAPSAHAGESVVENTTLDLTPNPFPSWAEVNACVTLAKDFLSHVAADNEDHRSAAAGALIAPAYQPGTTYFDEIVEAAFRFASSPHSVLMDEVECYQSEMSDLIYDYCEDSGEIKSPLYFPEPSPLLVILETAFIYYLLAKYPDFGAMSTRHLARLARVDIEVMEQQLTHDEIYFQPYGVSLREMEEMTSGEQMYWYRQYFVFSFKNYMEWLTKFPGFTPVEGALESSETMM